MLAYHSTRVVTCAMLPWCPPMLVSVGVKARRVKDNHPGWGSRVQDIHRAVLAPHFLSRAGSMDRVKEQGFT